MFLEKRFKRLIDRIRANAVIPLRLELWNGHRFDLSPAPTVTIAILAPSALRYFVPPDLNKLGEAFVEGHIRVEGSMHEVFRVSENLARSVAATTRAGFHYVTRHSRHRDRKAIDYHYDVSNDFYALFLDREHGLLVRLFPRRQRLAGKSAGTETRPHPQQADAEARRAFARHRLRLGRADRARGQKVRRRRDRHHAVEKSIRVRARAHPRRGPAGPLQRGAVRLSRPGGRRLLRQDRERRHVRARRPARTSPRVFRQNPRAARATTGWC